MPLTNSEFYNQRKNNRNKKCKLVICEPKNLKIEEVEKILESKPKFITKTLSFNLEVLKHIFEHNSLNYDGQDHKIEELPIKIGKVNEENSNVEFSLIECADVTWNWINELRELQGGLKATKEETIKINKELYEN